MAALGIARRPWPVIPKAVVFDQSTGLRGKLFEACCANLGSELLHTTPHHPPTNGKLERAFGDALPAF
jgi:transposase InsO family protein